jgi:hypothetical protein
MRIGLANSVEVDKVFPVFAERLNAACMRTGGDLSAGDLWQMCRSGNAFLVVAFDDEAFKAILIMQFQKWTDRQVMRCLAIVGDDMDEWLPAAKEFIAKMAKDGGATSFIAEGRDGWARIFPTAKKLRVTYEVQL